MATQSRAHASVQHQIQLFLHNQPNVQYRVHALANTASRALQDAHQQKLEYDAVFQQMHMLQPLPENERMLAQLQGQAETLLLKFIETDTYAKEYSRVSVQTQQYLNHLQAQQHHMLQQARGLQPRILLSRPTDKSIMGQ